MFNSYKNITKGFGARLKEERERLGFSQNALATAIGVKRLAQGSYEKELTSPNVRYLADAARQGVDLFYLLLGKHLNKRILSIEEEQNIEKRVFELIEEYVERSCDGHLSGDSRYILFDLMRKQAFESSDAVADLSVIDFSLYKS